ncbi:MAG: peptidylprolyl isomerase [Crocinitomicaceae bacterium]|nr:peptidylprolyl isomerase [Crocinitomicaceae bacterium]
MKFKTPTQYTSLFVISALLFGALGCSESGTSESTAVDASRALSRQVRIETSFGDMIVELSDSTPAHRDNFVKLASEGFYDSLLFHRVIKGFMVQGGDPNSRGASLSQRLGMGGPGYTVPAEIRTDHLHFKGALSAARQGDQANPQRASSGSQFYVVHGRKFNEAELLNIEARASRANEQFNQNQIFEYSEEDMRRYMEEGGAPFLDNQYTVFGQVISGLDIIDSIAAVQTGAGDRPMQDVPMTMEVIR